jgi:tRNA/tmRNA/rRNA uracil-C5-methylase (TrmA/RlmC/RlmD family)
MSDLDIVRLVAGGEGLGFIDGKAVFVRGVLPGEKVRIRVVHRRRDFERAELVEVLQPSPHRVSPGCGLAGICGGCDWLHIGYDEQLRQKSSIVQEALRRTGKIDIPLPEIETSIPVGARNRAQIHRDSEGRLGYMAAASNDIIPVATCPAVVEPLNRLFSGAAPAPRDIDRFTAFGADGWLAVEGRDDDRDLTVSVCGREIRFSVGSFFQSNLSVLPGLVTWALRDLKGSTAADLYCGVGLFGAFLAEHFSRIVCVEQSATSIGYARSNVAGADTELHPMSVEQWIASGGAPRAFDAIVVDPPRPGLAPEVREWLKATKPKTLVYVSCNPVTLARDLGDLIAAGFALSDLKLFDFYPQTSHVEAVARLAGPA